MIWSYFLPTEWDDKRKDWSTAYVFNLEEDREVDEDTFEIDIQAYYEMDGTRNSFYKEPDFEIEAGIKEKGYFIIKEQLEIVVPKPFSLEEFLEFTKIAIKELFNDESVYLSKGDEADFRGTNQDSRMIILAENMVKEIEDGAEKETGGDLKKYIDEHPEKFDKV